MSYLPDAVNGAFELSGCLFISLSISKLWRERSASGVHWGHVAFFSAWGFWNLYYYPSLGQLLSTVGAVGVLGANLVYLIMCIRYRNAPA